MATFALFACDTEEILYSHDVACINTFWSIYCLVKANQTKKFLFRNKANDLQV